MGSPIPEQALGQHLAIIGKTGSGKSWAARGVVEALLDRSARVCIVDPTSAWWGLKSSVTGKSAGYPVVIFGGPHADLPLAAQHGEAIAETIGTSSTPAIIDTSQMRIGERTRFFTDFADALLRKNRGPLHLVIDEAHIFAPQGKVDLQSGAMLHAANNLVSLGRSRGLKIMLITQRPAKLHKDSLTQVATLIAMRLTAPQDRRAFEEWVEDNADAAKCREIIASLAGLKTGEGWIWAPELKLLEQVRFPKIRTYDSSAAPDGSESGRQVLAPIDREAIAAKLQAVAADAVANDPATLKRRIGELERQAREAKPAAAAPPVDTGAIEQRGYARGLREAAAAIPVQAKALRTALHQAIEAALERFSRHEHIERIATMAPPPKPAAALRGAERVAAASPSVGRGGKHRIMVALAQYPEGLDTRKLALLTGLSSKGGTWSNYLSELRTGGLIEGNAERMRITALGCEQLGAWKPLPTGKALIDYWRGRLGSGGKRVIFDIIVDHYPEAVSSETVAQLACLSAQGGTWSNYLSELRGLDLIEGRGMLRATDTLFSLEG